MSIKVNRALRIGSKINSGTPGSILFIDSNNKIGEDNSNLFWDDSNDRIGIGTATPISQLHINGGTGTLATGISFGDGDTGIFEYVDDTIGIAVHGGSLRFVVNSLEFHAALYSRSASLAIYGGTYTTPNFTVHGDLDTGMGSGASDSYSMIAGGVEGIRVTEAGSVITTNLNGNVIINEAGADVDFRIEGVGQANALFVQGSDGFVGINNGTPAAQLDVVGDTRLGDSSTNYAEFSATGDQVFVGSSGLPFGEIWVLGNAVETEIVGAGTFAQFVGFTDNGQSNNTTPDHTNDHITIVKTGKYLIVCSFHVESIGAGAADTVSIEIRKNDGDVVFDNLHAHRKLSGGGGDIGSISVSGLADLTASDTIEVWLTNDDNATNLLVVDANLSLMQIGG